MSSPHPDGERAFTARDVRQAADLSYRQLNDWERKGALPQDEGRGAGWRKYTPREVFVMMVCAELRRRFGVPIERLRFVQAYMLQEGANHLQAAVELMALLGTGVWLVTDLEESFVMDSELEFRELVNHGWLGGDHPRATIWLKVNPLVNKLLSCLKEPIHLRAHGRGYEILRELRESLGVRTAEEHEILQLIRSGDYDKIDVEMKNGAIRTIRTNRQVTEPEGQDLEDLLRQHEYQTLTVTKRDGRIVSIAETVPRKRRTGNS